MELIGLKSLQEQLQQGARISLPGLLVEAEEAGGIALVDLVGLGSALGQPPLTCPNCGTPLVDAKAPQRPVDET